MIPKHFDKITIALMVLILVGMMIGSYKVNQQAAQINQIIDEQSPLIFAFPSTSQANVTFIVNCTRLEGEPKYACTTTQQTAPPTSTPTAIPRRP